MRIEEEIKLDYSDVLFRPKRSTLKSRKEVNLERTYKFKYSNFEWTGIPIIASNMDGVGELNVAQIMSEYKMITALTKQHKLDNIKKFPSIKKIYPFVSISCGTDEKAYKIVQNTLKELNFFQFLCIDVANGYSDHFSKFISSVRNDFPNKTIIAGTQRPII